MYFVDTLGRQNQTIVSIQAESGTNTSVAVTLSATAQYRHYIAQVLWSYSAAPTGGSLSISGLPGNETLSFDIVSGGPGTVLFPPLVGALSSQVVVTLTAGGVGIAGKLNVFYATIPSE